MKMNGNVKRGVIVGLILSFIETYLILSFFICSETAC